MTTRATKGHAGFCTHIQTGDPGNDGGIPVLLPLRLYTTFAHSIREIFQGALSKCPCQGNLTAVNEPRVGGTAQASCGLKQIIQFILDCFCFVFIYCFGKIRF